MLVSIAITLRPPAAAIAHKRSGGAGIGHLCGTASRVTRIIAAPGSILQPPTLGSCRRLPWPGSKEVRKRPEHRVGGLLQERTFRGTGLRTQDDQIRHLGLCRIQHFWLSLACAACNNTGYDRHTRATGKQRRRRYLCPPGCRCRPRASRIRQSEKSSHRTERPSWCSQLRRGRRPYCRASTSGSKGFRRTHLTQAGQRHGLLDVDHRGAKRRGQIDLRRPVSRRPPCSVSRGNWSGRPH